MRRHLTPAITSPHSLRQDDSAEAFTEQVPTGGGQASLYEAERARPLLTLARAPIWRHKLILTGTLDHRSVPELEEEIECLCEEGVTALTLDLRQLDAIDSTGVTAIARRGAVCKMQGHEFAVISDSRVICDAVAEAGATDTLTHDPNASVVRRFPNRSEEDSASHRSTAMMKGL